MNSVGWPAILSCQIVACAASSPFDARLATISLTKTPSAGCGIRSGIRKSPTAPPINPRAASRSSKLAALDALRARDGISKVRKRATATTADFIAGGGTSKCPPKVGRRTQECQRSENVASAMSSAVASETIGMWATTHHREQMLADIERSVILEIGADDLHTNRQTTARK